MAEPLKGQEPTPVSIGKLWHQHETALVEKLQRLASDVDALSADEQFRSMLLGMSRLLRYGYLNQVLIFGQRPSATWVEGPKQWEKLGRTVRSGEAPIWIAAPSRAGRPWPFFGVRVFDVVQTEGPPLADPCAHYTGDSAALPKLDGAAARLGLELVEVESIPSPSGEVVLGQAQGGRVLVRRDLAPLARCRTLAHEYAHELLHLAKGQREATGTSLNRESICETEADATAFVVLHGLGIEYNAPAYIAWRKGWGDRILRSMKRILAAARAIRSAADGQVPVLRIPTLEPLPRRAKKPAAAPTLGPLFRPRAAPFRKKHG